MAGKSIHGLGSLQAEVMEIVWGKEEASVADVVEAISKRRRVTYTTVLVAMQKLARKGWLVHRAVGRAYVYRAKRTRRQATVGFLKELLKTTFGGDPRALLSHLLETQPLDADELDRLRQLIEQRKLEVEHE